MQGSDKTSDAMIVMTTESQDGFEVAERVALISAQCAFGSRVFGDAFASVQDVVDGRVPVIEETMQEGVQVVLDDLRQQAAGLQADAVVAISIQYTPVGFGSSNMTLISGVGTVVKLGP